MTQVLSPLAALSSQITRVSDRAAPPPRCPPKHGHQINAPTSRIHEAVLQTCWERLKFPRGQSPVAWGH